MKKILLVVLMLPLLVLASCDKDDEQDISLNLDIIGTWECHKEYKEIDKVWYDKIIFKADGTGYREFNEDYKGENSKANCDFIYEIKGKDMTVTILKRDGKAVSEKPNTEEVYFNLDNELVIYHFTDDSGSYKRKQ